MQLLKAKAKGALSMSIELKFEILIFVSYLEPIRK